MDILEVSGGHYLKLEGSVILQSKEVNNKVGFMKRFLFTVLVLSSVAAAAKGKAMKISYSSYSEADRVAALSASVVENRVMVDAAPILMNGVGFAYERTVLPQVTVGPYLSFFKLTSDQEKTSGIAFKSDIRMYGMRARYFISEEAQRSGVYLMAGVGSVEVKTVASYSSLGNESSSVALGGIGGAGYQFSGIEVSSKKLAFSVGATYANGYSVENQAHFDSAGRADVDTPKAIGSIFLEGNIAFLF